ncbi:hypothetical protein CLF_111719 [Clonorchis sinensis]|uniref:Uncharacterized protein n=1 Tax=Clonorchis sinensis TaxID=79923 RepID=G7YV82_CLOSI|nr:hypothetical protein CLF_111719 [Clonorchis sinensis]
MSKPNVGITDVVTSTTWWYDGAVLDWLVGGFFMGTVVVLQKLQRLQQLLKGVRCRMTGDQSFQNSSRSPIVSCYMYNMFVMIKWDKFSNFHRYLTNVSGRVSFIVDLMCISSTLVGRKHSLECSKNMQIKEHSQTTFVGLFQKSTSRNYFVDIASHSNRRKSYQERSIIRKAATTEDSTKVSSNGLFAYRKHPIKRGLRFVIFTSHTARETFGSQNISSDERNITRQMLEYFPGREFDSFAEFESKLREYQRETGTCYACRHSLSAAKYEQNVQLRNTGREFDSFAEFESKLREYQRETGTCYACRHSLSAAKYEQNVGEVLAPSVCYAFRYFDCRSFMRLVHHDGLLVIVSFNMQHSHDLHRSDWQVYAANGHLAAQQECVVFGLLRCSKSSMEIRDPCPEKLRN